MSAGRCAVSERLGPRRPRLFLDTNTLVSAMAFRGPERWLLRYAKRGDVVALVSRYVLTECAHVLAAKLATPHGVITESIAGLPVYVVPEPQGDIVSAAAALLRDPDDAPVLAAAWLAGADALVTGDKDLHTAKQDRVRVIRTAEALAWIARGQTTGQPPP